MDYCSITNYTKQLSYQCNNKNLVSFVLISLFLLKQLWTKKYPKVVEWGNGAQWRAWKTEDGRVIDQVANVINQIRQSPDSRRLIVSAWNVGELEKMALMPCHAFFQFYVADGKLSCQLYQRSADIFLGVPFNIASYSLLLMMMAQVTGLKAGEFVHTFGDAHIYLNHLDQVNEQLERAPLPLPTMHINPEIKDIFDFSYNDFELVDYQSHPAIKAPIAV